MGVCAQGRTYIEYHSQSNGANEDEVLEQRPLRLCRRLFGQRTGHVAVGMMMGGGNIRLERHGGGASRAGKGRVKGLMKTLQVVGRAARRDVVGSFRAIQTPYSAGEIGKVAR